MSTRKEGLSLLSPKPKRKKSAADAATSILDELGVKRASSVRSKKTNPLGIQKKAEQKKEAPEELESWERKILKNHEIQISHTKTKILNKNEVKMKSLTIDVNDSGKNNSVSNKDEHATALLTTCQPNQRPYTHSVKRTPGYKSGPLSRGLMANESFRNSPNTLDFKHALIKQKELYLSVMSRE